MRYSKDESTYLFGQFESGDTVLISVYKALDNSVVVNAQGCTHLAEGVFKYLFSDSITEKTDYLFSMTNTIETQKGKITLGGYPDSIKDQTNQLNFTGDDLKATLDGETVTTDAASRNASKADVGDLSPANEYDIVLAAISSAVAGLDGDAMRGTDLTDVIESGLTFQQLLMVFFAILAGRTDGAGTETQHFRNTANDKNRVSASVDETGNRLSIVLDLT